VGATGIEEEEEDDVDDDDASYLYDHQLTPAKCSGDICFSACDGRSSHFLTVITF
jgi:hypothetical protein